jgi:hypothetical protein
MRKTTPTQESLPSVERVIQSHDLHDFFQLLVLLDVKLLDTRPKSLPHLWIDAPRANRSVWLVRDNLWRKHAVIGVWTGDDSIQGQALCVGWWFQDMQTIRQLLMTLLGEGEMGGSFL